MNLKPTPDRANVFLDVETTTLDNDNPNGALSALTGRIVCVCTLRDDGTHLTEQTFIGRDEAQLLQGFWRSLKPSDTLIGHNALNFDLTFIRQRSWIQGIRPSRRIDLRRFYTRDVVDTQQIFSNWGATKYPGLNELAEALGVGQKTGEGCQVGDWWAAGDLESIAAYCRADVRLSYKVYGRLMFLSLPDRFTALDRSSVSAEHAIA